MACLKKQRDTPKKTGLFQNRLHNTHNNYEYYVMPKKKVKTTPSEALYQVAESQQELFTARQAVQAGYDERNHPYHVKTGNRVKEYRGIYRLKNFPYSPDSQERYSKKTGLFQNRRITDAKRPRYKRYKALRDFSVIRSLERLSVGCRSGILLSFCSFSCFETRVTPRFPGPPLSICLTVFYGSLIPPPCPHEKYKF